LLGIGVNEQDLVPLVHQGGGQVEGDGRFAHPAFQVDDADDLHRHGSS
jgi:hypothetical protein